MEHTQVEQKQDKKQENDPNGDYFYTKKQLINYSIKNDSKLQSRYNNVYFLKETLIVNVKGNYEYSEHCLFLVSSTNKLSQIN